MKKMILFSVAFVAVFAVSLKLYAAIDPVGPNYYCRYDEVTATCSRDAKGVACYLVDENCNWID